MRCFAGNCYYWNGIDDCAAVDAAIGQSGACSAYTSAAAVPVRTGEVTVTGPDQQTVTYRQEFVNCGKCKRCREQGPSHGPYWYAYWKEGGRTRSRYIGRVAPDLKSGVTS